MNEITPQDPFRPMLAQSSINAGAVAIESERAIAEARGKIQVAKMFPRSMAQAMAEFMDACKSPDFANTAFYAVPNRGSGPSIRFMEEAARCYGNMQYGHRELSRSDGKSEVEVFAWDVERNNESKRQVTVLHIVDTKQGPKKLSDQADIDNRIANVASKQMRGRIAALMPKAMVAAGVAACKLTLAGGNDRPISQRVNDMVGAFGKYGVTVKHLAEYVGHTLDNVTIDELADLIGVFNALKEGAKASEYFTISTTSAVDVVANQVMGAIQQQAAAEPAAATSQAAQAPAAPRRRAAATPAAQAPAAQAQDEEPQQQAAAAPAPAPTPTPAPAPAAVVKQQAQPADDEPVF